MTASSANAPASQGRIALLGAPIEVGASRRGALMGPAGLRTAGLVSVLESLGYTVSDHGDILPRDLTPVDGPAPANARFYNEIAAWMRTLSARAYEIARSGDTPIFLGGDHSLSMGSVNGVARHWQEQGRKLFVLWLDAHADFNSPDTSPSGNMHGMPLAMAFGADNLESKVNDPRGATLDYWEQIKNVGIPGPKINPEDLVYIAVRDLEKAENYFINKYNINFIEVEEVKKKGPVEAAHRALAMLDHCDLIYISFDVDSIDSRFSTGTGTPVPNGLTVEEAKLLNAELCKDAKVCAYEIVEVNPTLDTENRMAESAFEILEASAKSIEARPVLAE